MAGQNGYRSAQTLWTSEIQKPFLWTEALNPYDWENPCCIEDLWCDEDVDEGERREVIPALQEPFTFVTMAVPFGSS
jgi:hypothetical protein